jgi:hypothetical protein
MTAPAPARPAASGRRGASSLAALVVIAGGLLLVLIGTHTTPTGYHASAGAAVHLNPNPPTGPRASPPPPRKRPAVNQNVTFPGWLKALALAASFAVVLVLAVTVLREFWPRLRWLLWRRQRRRIQDRGVAADLPRRLAQAVDEGLDELASGPVADAIIACWLRVHEVALESGIAPKRSDTPEQFVGRILADVQVRAQPLEQLADLYREARFSGHRMSEADRAAARAALEMISRDLAVTVP